ncbi:uncharacterized protein LOC135828380 [Sycon ciliatum]|uniref:uncharacterized protein LOC135828380 n=1 Tax=Sycon ciliatum TaxID=27933 RepID=UPI0031F62C18
MAKALFQSVRQLVDKGSDEQAFATLQEQLSVCEAGDVLHELYHPENEDVLSEIGSAVLTHCVSSEQGSSTQSGAPHTEQELLRRQCLFWMVVERLMQVGNAMELCLTLTVLFSEETIPLPRLFLLLGATRIVVSRLADDGWHKQVAHLIPELLDQLWHKRRTTNVAGVGHPDLSVVCAVDIQTDVANLRTALAASACPFPASTSATVPQPAMTSSPACLTASSHQTITSSSPTSATGDASTVPMATMTSSALESDSAGARNGSAHAQHVHAANPIDSANTAEDVDCRNLTINRICTAPCAGRSTTDSRHLASSGDRVSDGHSTEQVLVWCVHQLLSVLFGLATRASGRTCKSAPSLDSAGDGELQQVAITEASRKRQRQLVFATVMRVVGGFMEYTTQRCKDDRGIANRLFPRNRNRRVATVEAVGDDTEGELDRNVFNCVLLLCRTLDVDTAWLFEAPRSVLMKTLSVSQEKRDSPDEEDESDPFSVPSHALACFKSLLVTRMYTLSSLPQIWSTPHLFTCCLQPLTVLLADSENGGAVKIAMDTIAFLCREFAEPFSVPSAQFDGFLQLVKSLCRVAGRCKHWVQTACAGLRAVLCLFDTDTTLQYANAILKDTATCVPFIAGCVIGSVVDAMSAILSDKAHIDQVRHSAAWKECIVLVTTLPFDTEHWMINYDRYMSSLNLVFFLRLVSVQRGDADFFLDWQSMKLTYVDAMRAHFSSLEAQARAELDRVQTKAGYRHSSAEERQVQLHHLGMLLSRIATIASVDDK